MDKVSIGFLADVLYIKGVICFEEYEDIMSASVATDIDAIVEKMLREGYNVHKRPGESYINYKKL